MYIIEDQQTEAIRKTMNLEIQEFCSKYQLSRRETEIVMCITNKIIHFKDIAAHLNVSPSTVNNHFKNIFNKTGTNSKSELLTTFLEHVFLKLRLLQVEHAECRTRTFVPEKKLIFLTSNRPSHQ